MQDISIMAFSSNSVNGVNYLCFGGSFKFTVSGYTYNGVALCNLDQSAWSPINLTFKYNSLADVLLDGTGIVYLAGCMQVSSQEVRVLSYNMLDSSYLSYFDGSVATECKVLLFILILIRTNLFMLLDILISRARSMGCVLQIPMGVQVGQRLDLICFMIISLDVE